MADSIDPVAPIAPEADADVSHAVVSVCRGTAICLLWSAIRLLCHITDFISSGIYPTLFTFLGSKSTKETISFRLLKECSRPTRNSEVEFGYRIQRGFGVSRWLFKYRDGTDARVWIRWATEGNLWGLLYSREQCSAYFITSETKIRYLT